MEAFLLQQRLFLLFAVLLVLQAGMSQGLRRTYKVRRYNFDEDEKSAESSESEEPDEDEHEAKHSVKHQGRGLLTDIGDGLHSFSNWIFGKYFCPFDRRWYYDPLEYNTHCGEFRLFSIPRQGYETGTGMGTGAGTGMGPGMGPGMGMGTGMG